MRWDKREFCRSRSSDHVDRDAAFCLFGGFGRDGGKVLRWSLNLSIGSH